jgi:hypothetical protein
MDSSFGIFKGHLRLTVTSRSLSRDGRVDGAKCSFRITHCLMINSLSRMDCIRDSGEPEMVKGVDTLVKFRALGDSAQKIHRPLKCSIFLRPMPQWHLESVDNVKMAFRID